MLTKVFILLIGIMVMYGVYVRIKEWFFDTFPELAENIVALLGAIALFVIVSIYFGLGGFIFMTILYIAWIINSTTYWLFNIFNKSKK